MSARTPSGGSRRDDAAAARERRERDRLAREAQRRTAPERAARPERTERDRPERTTRTQPERAKRTQPERATRSRPERATRTQPERTKRTQPERTTRARPVPATRARAAGGAGATAARERHEGLVVWIARTVTSIPRRAVGVVGGVAHEVGVLLGGIVRPVARLGSRAPALGGAGRAVAARTRRAAGTTDRAMEASDGSRGRGVNRTTDGARGTAAPTGEAGRRASARRRQVLQRRIRVGLVLALLVAVGAAWLVVPASDAFRIRHVEVTGASSVGDLELRRSVDHLLEGKTVYTVDEGAVERRIERFPFVRQASVVRHLPGGLELRVVEYRPLALGTADGHHYWLIARDGRVLARAKAKEWTGLPLVQLVGRHPHPGDHIADEPALRVLAARAADSTLVYQSIDVRDGRIVGHLDGDVEVRFGRTTALRAKSLVAELVQQYAARHGVKLAYIDVTVAGRAAFCRDDRAMCHAPRGPVDDVATDEVPDDASTAEELDDPTAAAAASDATATATP
ncbi:MAG: Polypeptide-transport-associated domain protein FtsQ-type [Thermoleophilia bacterium]|nr:Polypeptide-transport-associated domain protein FtsQ-type [Thermoleophilia bacterium]